MNFLLRIEFIKKLTLLGVRLIVILGHESCEIVKAALVGSSDKTTGSPDMDTVISSIYVEEKNGRTIASVNDDLLNRKAVTFNVNGIAERLLKRSLVIRKHVEEGKVSIVLLRSRQLLSISPLI
ncbi:MAG: carbonic anhydrase [Bdellovibrionia bacterium]